MDCENSIKESLASLDVVPERTQDFLATDEKCVAQLVSLDHECSSSMARIARELLKPAREGDEYKLQVVLRALFRRNQPEALDIIIEAIVSPDTDDKETYITYLLEFDGPRVTSTLIDFVASALPMSSDEELEDAGWALVKAIDALRYHRIDQAASAVLPRLMDKAYRVRRAAIDFLVDLDIKGAASSFIQCLDQEDDPDNMEALIGGLQKWNYAPAVPYLQRALESRLAHENDSVREALQGAIAKLG
jgi:HEAT repeat protein